ncbi:ABC transporter permease subunit [Actinoplanes sp. NPDC051851]|uniref:ABC transporter permease n=1 Tax=Actinoplanes sp. NPDC051851 TaxID=3154753 RepID=UPI0034250A0E
MRGVTGFAVLLLGWEGLRMLRVLPPTAAPGVRDVVASADAGLVRAAGETLLAWALGLALAAVIGIGLGVLVGLSRWADDATRPTTEFLRPIPVVALIPVAIVLIGIDTRMQAALVGLACLWPLMISTRFGVRDVDPLLIESGRVLGASGLRLVTRVTWPAALPAIRTGLRTAASLGIVVAIAVELVAGSPGLGHYIAQQQAAGQIAASYAGVLVSGVLGWAISATFRTRS